MLLLTILKCFLFILVLPFRAIWLTYHLFRDPLHVLRVAHSHLREATKARSSRWRSTRRKWLVDHPECVACGSRKWLQVHHLIPYETDPSLELEFSNLITLCERVGGRECHRILGHGGSYNRWVPKVKEFAARVRNHPEQRKKLEQEAKDASQSIH